MPDVPAMALASPTVDIAEVYSAGLFAPAAAPGSLETLNGGMDADNYGGGNDSIPGWVAQYGSHAVALHTGSFRQEFTYARQSSGQIGNGTVQRVLHAGLCNRFFLPWQASLVLYSWQAWWNHDATYWDSDSSSGGPYREQWDWRVQVDGSTLQGLYGVLPPGRISTSTADAVGAAYVDPGIHVENRWRYVNRVCGSKNLAKGHHAMRLSVWSKVLATDQKLAKLKTLSWALSILAIR